ncbi:MAG TPA: hypothetical protein VM261_35850 [Kofleriaceae bacterium]|nr:hypothetical protein [Kofleriaceae bacterium]
MVATAIASVASFSVVLAESFAAVGLSTIMPNLFIAAAKAAKGVAGGTGSSPELIAKLNALHTKLAAGATASDTEVRTAAAAVDTAFIAAGAPQSATTAPATELSAMFHGESPVKKAMDMVAKAAHAVDHLDVLVPTKASIDAEFEFHAAEKMTGEAALGAAIEMVTIKAGYSALYEATSRNKVSLHVEFALVGVDL